MAVQVRRFFAKLSSHTPDFSGGICHFLIQMYTFWLFTMSYQICSRGCLYQTRLCFARLLSHMSCSLCL